MYGKNVKKPVAAFIISANINRFLKLKIRNTGPALNQST